MALLGRAWGFYLRSQSQPAPRLCQLCGDILRDWFVLKFRCAPNEKASIAADPAWTFPGYPPPFKVSYFIQISVRASAQTKVLILRALCE